MGFSLRLSLLALVAAAGAPAAPPPDLATALEYLRNQKSYSWEVINADPGPVKQQFETRRGVITLVQQNTSPHIKGTIDRSGDMLIRREWADGLRLDTVITAGGAMLTRTPEGWMTGHEILSALAEERLSGNGVTPRYIWLRRADRPELHRPDEEILPLLDGSSHVAVDGDAYVVKGEVRAEGSGQAKGEAAAPTVAVTLTLHLRSGIIRDYEVRVEGTRALTPARLQVPVSDQRIVILTYVPVSRIDVPDDVRERLKEQGTPGLRR